MKRLLLSLTFTVAALWGMALQLKAADGLAGMIDMDYSGKADTLTTSFIRQFLNQSKGTFWAVPSNQNNRESETTYIYWQQAHAMDALIYSYQRIKDTKPQTAATYKRYMNAWYINHANNWYHDNNDPTGFLNEYTDDMCWISLTLMHMSEALEDDKYANTARKLFDDYIEPRGWEDDDHFWGLPWKSNDMGRNACTNAPGSLLASKLYLKYGEEKYKERAIDMYNYLANEMKTKMNNDGRVEDPPLTYTQGTFAEACRVLYHITNENAYIQMANKVANYVCTSTRCTSQGLLRHEGTSMDQSIFKAVAIPYLVNLALDPSAGLSYRRTFIRFLQKNAKALWEHLDLTTYPAIYCPYYWGETINTSEVPSMGAMTSGVSLMENVARMAIQLTKEAEEAGIHQTSFDRKKSEQIYSLDGRLINQQSPLRKGLYIKGNKKVMVK